MPESVLIVTPSLNQGRFIRETIESVLSQDYAPLTYRVVDGGSTDTTLAVLKEFESDPRFHWVSEPDRGQAHAICKGINQGEGEILAWLNADDVYEPGAIREAVRKLQENAGAGMVSGGIRLVDEYGQNLGEIPGREMMLEEMLMLRDFVPQPGVFFRREDFIRSGGLDEALHYAFDLDLFLRLRRQGEMCYSTSTFAGHRLHAESKTVSRHVFMRREAAQVARRFLAEAHVGGKQRRLLLSRADLVEAYAAYRLQNRAIAVRRLVSGLFRHPGHLMLVLKGIKRHLGGPTGHEF